MRARVDHRQLVAVVKLLASFTDKASRNMPILGGMLLRADDGQLAVEAIDHDIVATAHVAATVHAQGAVVVDAASLVGAVSGLSGDVDLDASTGYLRIAAGDRTVQLHPHDLDAWPEIASDPRPPAPSTLSGPALSQLLLAPWGFTLTATGAADRLRHPPGGGEPSEAFTRQTAALRHIMLASEGGQLHAHASNGAAFVRASLPTALNIPAALVSAKAARRVAKAITKRSHVRLGLAGDRLVVQAEDPRVTLRVKTRPADLFPRGRKWLSIDKHTPVLVERKRLLEAVRWLQRGASGAFSLSFMASDSKLRLEVDDPDRGVLGADVELASPVASPIAWRLSVSLTLGACTSVGGDRMTIYASPDTLPVIFAGEGRVAVRVVVAQIR